MTDSKICSKCKVDKELDSFSRVKDARGNGRTASWCKPCMSLDQKERRERNAPLVKKPVNTHYLSNKELFCEIIVSKAQGKLTRKAEKMFLLIIKNVGKKFYYNTLDDRHDCQQEASLQVFKNWMSFNEENTDNAFSYITEISKRGYAKAFNDLYKINGSYQKHLSLNTIYGEGEGDMNI